MSKQPSYDVIVVGAGMVGAAVGMLLLFKLKRWI